MNELPEDLLPSFERYDAMQEAHLKFLEPGDHPDIQKLNFERAKAFEDLKNQLTRMRGRLRGQEGAALEIALACQDRLAWFRERDHLLARRMDEYRAKLEQHLQQLRQGKKALHIYGRLNSTIAPRFVSESG